MIFDWEKEFSEKLIDEGLSLDDKVSYVTTHMDYLSGIVDDGDKSYSVSIDLDENFRIESMECDCKKKKCRHMTALILASHYLSNRYIDFDYSIEELDTDKLVSFVKEEVSYNEDCQDEFKDTFRKDIINNKTLSYDEELYLILEDFEWGDYLLDYIKNNLIGELYDKGEYKVAFFLITLMFNKVIDRVSFDDEKSDSVVECYDAIVDLIMKLSEKIEDIIFDYLTDLLERNYSAMYPPFAVLMKFYSENFKDEKYQKVKHDMFFKQ